MIPLKIIKIKAASERNKRRGRKMEIYFVIDRTRISNFLKRFSPHT